MISFDLEVIKKLKYYCQNATLQPGNTFNMLILVKVQFPFLYISKGVLHHYT